MRVMLICVALALAGCSEFGGPRGGGSGGPPSTRAALQCMGGSHPGNCTVVVDRNCHDDCASVSHDPVIVTGGANKIMWVLAKAHLKWRGAGIVPDPSSGIHCDSPNGNTVQCSNEGKPHASPGWKYTVQIQGAPDLDPFIVNN